MADAEKVVTADQGGRINLGKSRAGSSFRVLEQVVAGNLVEGPDLDAAHALATSFPTEDASEDDPLA